MKQKMVILMAALLVLASALYYHKTKANSQTVKYLTATASKGTLISSVSGSGNIVVDQLTKVNPSITGTVTGLNVKLGDQVKKGQTLFTITNNQLDVTVGKAEAANLQAKQALATAQGQLATAKANLTNQLQDSGQSKAQASLDQANQGLATAQATLSQDQATLNSTASTASNFGVLQAKVNSDQAAVTAAQDNVNAVTIALQQSQNSASATIEAARQQVTAAQNGVEAAQKNVATTQGDLNNQRANADQRTVTAPIDGTITTLSISNGDQLTGGGSNNSSSTSSAATAPVVIADLTTLKASLQINEVDAPKVQAGQKVSMTFDAIDSLSLTGKVEKIDTVGTVTQGVVTYAATIDLDSLDPRVRPQMSVSALITISVKQDVLTVPNSAVKTSGGSSYVQIMQNGTPVQQTVVTGSTNDTDTEITSGLSEGETVVTQTINPTTAAKTTTGTGLGIPGIGGGGGGATRLGGGARGGN